MSLQATVQYPSPVMISGNDLEPIGSVQFQIGGADVGSPVTLDGSSSWATITLSPAQALALATFGATAVYTSSSVDFLDSSGTLPAADVTTATTTAVTASSTTPTFGQAVTFTATVTPQIVGLGPPTGTVHFDVDGADYSSTLVSSPSGVATASITLDTLASGAHHVTAAYSSDSGTFESSSSPPLAPTTVGAFGYGPYQFSGDGGPATAAVLSDPQGLAVDAHGDLFIADANDNVVREVSPTGTITTVAGTGTAGYSGDGGQATAAMLNDPIGIAVDANGDLFIADSGNNVVREVLPSGMHRERRGHRRRAERPLRRGRGQPMATSSSPTHTIMSSAR